MSYLYQEIVFVQQNHGSADIAKIPCEIVILKYITPVEEPDKSDAIKKIHSRFKKKLASYRNQELICNVNQSADFYVVQLFIEGYYQTDYSYVN